MDRLCGDTCSYVCPQTWLNEAKTNIGMSPTMGFLNENVSLAYFAILGELSSGLPFIVGFFKTYVFSHHKLGFSGGKEGHASQHPNVLVSLRRPNIKRQISWLSALNLKDIPYNGDSRETLDKVHVTLLFIIPSTGFIDGKSYQNISR